MATCLPELAMFHTLKGENDGSPVRTNDARESENRELKSVIELACKHIRAVTAHWNEYTLHTVFAFNEHFQ